MKYIILTLLLCLALVPKSVWAQVANSLLLTQRDSTNTTYVGRITAPPAGTMTGVLAIDGATKTPTFVAAGVAGLSLLATGTAAQARTAMEVVTPSEFMATMMLQENANAVKATMALAPIASSGSASDLSTGTIAWERLPSISYGSLTGQPTSWAYGSITGAPTSYAWGSVTSVPATYTPTAHTQTMASVDGLTTTIAAINATASLKLTIPSGTTGQYVSGNGTLQSLPTQITLTINDSPGRSMVTTTSGTGFQISATRPSSVCYEGTFQTTSTIGGPASITVFLETADTNSTTPGDWTIKAQQVNSNTITLAVVLQQVDIEPWSLCRNIPAGKFVRIRSGSVSGTASATINSQQQETVF